MITTNKKLGFWGEGLAERYLKKRGYDILDHRYTSRFGEIDLVAREKNELVFIEVKTRKSLSFGWPEEAISLEKINRLISTVYCYLEDNNLTEIDYRIDVILIYFSPFKKNYHLRHLKNVQS